jgi:heptosyltransferase II
MTRARMEPIRPERVGRVLIRAANWVGDAVMSTPLTAAVRGNFPAAEIVVLAKPWVGPLFEESPDVDRVLTYDARGRHRGAAGKLRLAAELRRERFDLAILVQNAFEAALIPALAGVPIRLGYATDGRGTLLTHPVPMTRRLKRRHMIDYYLGIVEGAGLRTFGRKQRLPTTPAERIAAEDRLRAMDAGPARPRIGFAPGAAFGTAKQWPPSKYAALARRIGEVWPGASVLVFGGPGDRDLGDRICAEGGPHCRNLAGATGLREAVALIERCDRFVTNDSGLMHVAAALEIPLIAVFGPTDAATTYPASRAARIVREPVPCSPCMKRECPLGHHRCMRDISPERVLAALRRMG